MFSCVPCKPSAGGAPRLRHSQLLALRGFLRSVTTAPISRDALFTPSVRLRSHPLPTIEIRTPLQRMAIQVGGEMAGNHGEALASLEAQAGRMQAPPWLLRRILVSRLLKSTRFPPPSSIEDSFAKARSKSGMIVGRLSEWRMENAGGRAPQVSKD